MESPAHSAGLFLFLPFAYYRRLNPRQKKIYRASDAVAEVPLPRPAAAAAALGRIKRGLEDDDRAGLTRACRELTGEIHHQLGVSAVEVRVLAKRPSRTWGELQGLYELAVDGEPARITVWMRTAQRRQVVAFRTFLRTLLHEICHHLDYELLTLADSFHTQGFFQRESSLFHQLMEGVSEEE